MSGGQNGLAFVVGNMFETLEDMREKSQFSRQEIANAFKGLAVVSTLRLDNRWCDAVETRSR
jgi:hypothetical protein